MKINSKQKGAVGEREFAQVLKDAGFEARRGIQYHGGHDSPDVVSDDKICHWEVKRTERLTLYNALEQAIKDCPSGKTPVVAHRQSRREWVAILRMKDFLDMLKFLKIAEDM